MLALLILYANVQRDGHHVTTVGLVAGLDTIFSSPAGFLITWLFGQAFRIFVAA